MNQPISNSIRGCALQGYLFTLAGVFTWVFMLSLIATVGVSGAIFLFIYAVFGYTLDRQKKKRSRSRRSYYVSDDQLIRKDGV